MRNFGDMVEGYAADMPPEIQRWSLDINGGEWHHNNHEVSQISPSEPTIDAELL